MMPRTRLIGLFFLLTVSAIAADTPEYRVTQPPKALDLDPFYKKYVDADGLPVVSSEKTSDYALKEAAYLIGRMLRGRKDLVDAMARDRVHVAVMAYSERTVDIPEHSDMKPASYWNKRARGLGGRTTSCGEENLLNYPGDPYHSENILIHEFAHCIHDHGLARLDPEFNNRLRAIYDASLAKGLWKGTYAASSTHEFWAEGVQSWFGTNRHDDSSHNHVDTREELKEYDPALAALIAESFPDNDFQYVRPDRREQPGHLAGFDRSAAPRFAWRPEDTGKRDESQK